MEMSQYLSPFRANPPFKRDLREFVTLGALDDIVQDQDIAIIAALEDENLGGIISHRLSRNIIRCTDILVQRLLVVQDLVDLQSHCLAGPHVRDLAEPAICKFDFQQTSFVSRSHSADKMALGVVREAERD